MPTLSYYQRAWDDRHPDDHRTAADDAAEQAAECMADFDRRTAERKARESGGGVVPCSECDETTEAAE